MKKILKRSLIAILVTIITMILLAIIDYNITSVSEFLQGWLCAISFVASMNIYDAINE